jgi:hypothetical protein
MKRREYIILILSIFSLLIISCSLPFMAKSAPTPVPPTLASPPVPTPTIFFAESNLPTLIPPTSTPSVVHVAYPVTSPPSGGVVYDVISQDTADEKRAPYGDSYNINRLERPFTQDMAYVPDLDIVTFSLSSDETWHYVSIEMLGKNPNNEIGINFGVEIDSDGDGFGDVIIWAQPPYTSEWANDSVTVFKDSNHDTAGLSSGLSDAPLETDGYDTALLDIPNNVKDDPDLAWVRSDAGLKATIQFAFKRSLTDGGFMLGVMADASLRDIGQLDYVDRFLPEDAGSPVRSNKYYPLGELYLVDNTCQEAFGYKPTGYEPKLCPRPEKEPGEQAGCTNPSQYTTAGTCTAAGCAWVQNAAILTHVAYHCVAP